MDLRSLSLPSLLFTLGGTLLLWKLFRAIFAPFLSRQSLPPGPPPLPLIGNLLDIPKEKEWLTFAAWGDKWGDLIHVSLPGQPGLLILNSVKTATDLLDKQSSIYSDRPIIPMGGELVGWKRILGLLRYKPGATESDLSADTQRFKTIRRHFHQVLGSQTSVQKFDAVLESETKAFLKRVLNEVEGERWKNLQEHIRRTAAGGALHMIYGYQADEFGDPFVALADRAMSTFSISTSPGGFLVNSIPILKYVPSWFPGGGFKKTAEEWKEIGDDLTDKPFNWVQSQMHAGKVPYSFVSSLLNRPDPTPEQGYDIKWAASSMYAGAADTTVASVYSLFQAMAIYPEVLKKAQEELDTVVGTGRLPLLSDRPDLPYMNALASELLRWHTVAPLALPHRAAEDNVYEGYFIPKGTIVFANVWKMGHNVNDYHDPEVFNPDRFLGLSPEPDPRGYCWGFGRRICPGRLLADSSVFINCAMILAAFDIMKYSDNGKMVEPVVDQTTGIISHPTLFKCLIRPRSTRVPDLL